MVQHLMPATLRVGTAADSLHVLPEGSENLRSPQMSMRDGGKNLDMGEHGPSI